MIDSEFALWEGNKVGVLAEKWNIETEDRQILLRVPSFRNALMYMAMRRLASAGSWFPMLRFSKSMYQGALTDSATMASVTTLAPPSNNELTTRTWDEARRSAAASAESSPAQVNRGLASCSRFATSDHSESGAAPARVTWTFESAGSSTTARAGSRTSISCLGRARRYSQGNPTSTLMMCRACHKFSCF